MGGFVGNSRMIKVADVDGDGKPDILTGGAYQTQLKLFVRTATGWTDASAQLPQQLTSIGDAEFGDVDGDGDLDIVLVDWGSGAIASPGYLGGRTRLYLNDGHGTFTEATMTQMPDQLVKWSWDLSLADVDNDFDLDILVSCKLCTTSYIFLNDGHGNFANAPNALPHFSNNYDLEAMDINGDGFVDLATINDGPNSTSHLFVNRGDGTFADETSTRLTGATNPGTDDNAVVWLDANSDGHPDMLVASLSGPDRLLINDGTGKFTLSATTATPNDTPGSLGIQVADLDGDGRLDIVQSQGEPAQPEKVELATSLVAIDTAPPIIAVDQFATGSTIRARIHDNKSPLHLEDFQRVWVVVDGVETDMHWYGEYLWTAAVAPGFARYRACAKDRAGNQACSPDIDHTSLADDIRGDDAPTIGPGGTKPGGCCDAGRSPGGSIVLALVVGLALSARSRSRSRRSGSAPRDRRST